MSSHGTKKTLGNTSWFTHDRFGMFIHLVEYPPERLLLKGAAGRVEYAQFLHDGSEILFREENGDIRFEILRVRPKLNASVIKLFLK